MKNFSSLEEFEKNSTNKICHSFIIIHIHISSHCIHPSIHPSILFIHIDMQQTSKQTKNDLKIEIKNFMDENFKHRFFSYSFFFFVKSQRTQTHRHRSIQSIIDQIALIISLIIVPHHHHHQHYHTIDLVCSRYNTIIHLTTTTKLI